MPETIRESMPGESFEDRIDAEQGIVRDVAIIGQVSKNRRNYNRKTLESAASKYEGAKVYVDHGLLEGRSATQERGTKEFFGTIRNVRYVEGDMPGTGKLRGDHHYPKDDTYTKAFVERATRFSTTFGFSHVAEAETRIDPKTKGVEVTKINRVLSVDLVESPATNVSLFESIDPTNTADTESKYTLAEVLAEVDQPIADVLLEQLGELGVADSPMPPPMPGGLMGGDMPTAQAAIKAGIKQAIVGILDDDSIDAAASLEKIKALLDAQETAMGSNVPPEDAATGVPPEAKPEDESKPEGGPPAPPEKQEESVTGLRAANLLLESGRAATPIRVKALAPLLDSADDCKELIESFPRDLGIDVGSSRGTQHGTPGRKLATSGPAHVSEGYQRRWKAITEKASA